MRNGGQVALAEVPHSALLLGDGTGRAARKSFCKKNGREGGRADRDLRFHCGGVEKELWIVPESGHVKAMDNFTGEFKERVGAFVDDVLDE